MPLAHLLYRCPRCGEDPVEGGKDEVSCPTCGAVFRRGGKGGRITVSVPGEGEWSVPSDRLSQAIAELGGPATRATDPGGRISYAARVEVRRAQREDPVWYRGDLRGFAERFGAPEDGVLQIDDLGVSLLRPGESTTGPTSKEKGALGASPEDPQEVPVTGALVERWPFLEIGALQTSSSSVQISPKEGGVVEFRFPGDSPKRWDELLRMGVQAAYSREGKGRVLEFQPRIVTR